jgi:hypothetical protein
MTNDMIAHSMRASIKPWYRERWPWLLAAGPAIVVVAALFTGWLALSSDDGLVADDYYKRGLGINRMLEREALAGALDAGAIVAMSADGHVRADLAIAGNPPASLRLRLAHPTRAGHDALAVLDRAADGSYRGSVAGGVEGRRLVSVETDAWRLPPVETVTPGEVRLGAARVVR